ncbi:hypothetical protein L484_009803 [Morus notabilis]|uniref:Uncharacterized protein n=1 Tax=Morus notabilis TaxID=981085 RepID=W9SHC6_9ROSA|nr:hypothetical protein L484_009803 [Morus notabilis]
MEIEEWLINDNNTLHTSFAQLPTSAAALRESCRNPNPLRRTTFYSFLVFNELAGKSFSV